mgnify:CR=1 FL=1
MSDTSDNKLFAVFRNGVRVSDTEYPSPLFAQKELEYWQNVVKKFPDGSKVEVRPVTTQK